MANPEAILQLARLAGRQAFHASLGFQEGEEPAVLDDAQHDRVRALIDDHIEAIAGGLLEEAMASDDVTDAGSAIVYLRDRLDFLGDLLSAEQQQRIASAFEGRVASW